MKRVKKIRPKSGRKIQRQKQKKNQKRKPEEYKAEEITVLEGLEPVQKRPAMYIGTTGLEGLHHLIWEVVDNGIDEAMAGYCTEIKVELLPDNIIRVSDNGRGIPVDIHKPTKKSALEVVMTRLHAGAKFSRATYKVAGGLHGVGISVVNALSKYLKAEVHREGKIWMQEYKKGKPLKKVRVVGKTRQRGTVITFQPDPEIFPKIEFDWQKILDHLRQQAYLTKGVKIIVVDSRQQPITTNYTFYFEGGIKSYVRHLNRNLQPKQETIFYVEKEENDIVVEIAFQYTDEYKETIFAFANNIYNSEGGTHLVGFRTALTRTLNNFSRRKGFLKEKEENLTGEDVREGLTAVISVKVKEPQFEGQTKAKLGNAEVRPVVESIFSEALGNFLEEHPKEAEAIISKCLLASRARQAAKVARESVLRKGVLEGFTLPGKLADCTSREPEESELYIVEGESAGGSAKQGRDRFFQAILPLRGKILNVERAHLDKMLANNEIKSLIIALGTNIGEQFDINNLRYKRIIIMTDADVDGAHIRTLLLTLFYRYFPEIIKRGYLYIAQPPLYRIQKGKEVEYVYTEEEKTKKLQSYKVTKLRSKKKKEKEEILAETVPVIGIQRYKGLGEMNPSQLWETTMDPEKRLMKQVTIEDAEKADEIFEILMGHEVAPRKRFIQTHAKNVKNLDI
jgi:DNA gyrase subunit B